LPDLKGKEEANLKVGKPLSGYVKVFKRGPVLSDPLENIIRNQPVGFLEFYN